MSKVFIAIPAGDAYVHARLVQSLVPQLKEYPFLIVAGVSPVALARNVIVENFLKTDATHLWMIDADTIPPPDALEILLAVDVDIATGITPILRQGSRTSNIYEDTSGVPMELKDTEHKKKPFPIAGCGAACLLIRREVLEKVGKPWFAEVWGDDGTHMSEDVFFGNRATEEGFTLTCVPTVVCGHARSVII